MEEEPRDAAAPSRVSRVPRVSRPSAPARSSRVVRNSRDVHHVHHEHDRPVHHEHAVHHVTSRVMSPYEKTALLGMRTQELARGSKSTLDPAAVAGKSPQEVAQMELDANAVPLVVSRVLPDGRHEDVPATSLRVAGDFRP